MTHKEFKLKCDKCKRITHVSDGNYKVLIEKIESQEFSICSYCQTIYPLNDIEEVVIS